MPDTDHTSRYTTMRIPRDLLTQIESRAKALEAHFERCSLQQAKTVNLPGGLHDRFGIAPWQIVERLLLQESAKQERQRRYRERRKQEKAMSKQITEINDSSGSGN